MNKTINIDHAVVDTEKFRQYNASAQQILREQLELTQSYKDLVKYVADETKLKKSEVSGYFKARFNEKAEDTVKKGELYDTLNDLLDN